MPNYTDSRLVINDVGSSAADHTYNTMRKSGKTGAQLAYNYLNIYNKISVRLYKRTAYVIHIYIYYICTRSLDEQLS